MNALLTSAALGLLAAWPAAGVGWLLGEAADRLTDDPRARARTWGLAAALPPLALATVVGVAALPERAAAVARHAAIAANLATEAHAALVSAPVAGVTPLDLWAPLLLGAATGGLVLAAARQALGLWRIRAIARRATPAPSVLALALRDEAYRLDTPWPDLRVSAAVDQPLLAGLSRPTILLPAALVERLDVAALTPICAHELAHLKRGDNWRLLAESLLAGLLWIVPPAAALLGRAAATRETLCDALALTDASPADRRAYSETLLTVLRARAASSLHPAFTGKTRKLAHMRLQAITSPRPPARAARKALIAGFALGAVALTAGGSIAFAGKAESGSRSHAVFSDGRREHIDIRAENEQWAVRPATEGAAARTTVYSGGVRLSGKIDPAQTLVQLNGAPPPAGFDPMALKPGAIERLELTEIQGGTGPNRIINIVLKAS